MTGKKIHRSVLPPVRRIQILRTADALNGRSCGVFIPFEKAPYIIHQVVTTNDLQPQGERIHATAKLRTVFCVYSPNEEEGSLMLLNLMERLRIALLKQVVIGHQFTLDTTVGLERLMYLDDTAPYYIGEMATEWILPPVQREVSPWEPNPRP